MPCLPQDMQLMSYSMLGMHCCSSTAGWWSVKLPTYAVRRDAITSASKRAWMRLQVSRAALS